MTCRDCELAAARVWHAFTYPCQGCAARSIVRGPHFRRVQQAGMQDRQYREDLRTLGVTHEEVRAQAATDMLVKQEKARSERRRSSGAQPGKKSTDAQAHGTSHAGAPPNSHPAAAPASPAFPLPQLTP